jgi:phosphoribosylformylglycinamidine (FGAM) synthase-like enzyme
MSEEKVSAVHDVSDGGLLVAVAEMALAGNRGAELFPYEGKLPAHAVWFGEDQGRYVLAANPSMAEEIAERARLLGLAVRIIGRTGGDAIQLKGEAPLSLAQLRKGHAAWLPEYMSGKRNS